MTQKTKVQERPILFNTEMVRALLNGEKTQTRRVVKCKATIEAAQSWCQVVETKDAVRIGKNKIGPESIGHMCSINPGPTLEDCVKIFCPFGKKGDRLWVRETWRIGAWDENDGLFAIDYRDGPRREWLRDPNDHDGSKFNLLWQQCTDELIKKGIASDSNGQYQWEPGDSPLRWRPSIHMPRWVSRISLEIVDVRIERLHGISESDCRAEGYPNERNIRSGGSNIDPWLWFRTVWKSTNGHESWESNPLVWVIEFKNID